MFHHFLSWSAWNIRKPFSAVLVLQYAFAVFVSEKAHGARLFTRLFVHADRRFPRPFAGAVGTLFENAKLIFPMWAVETASAAVFITSGTAGLIAVKSRFLLHEQFKSPPLVVCEKHSGCTSFPAGIKKRHNLFFELWRSMQKGTLSLDNVPFAWLFTCNLFARCP